jgi:hypothetical protein
MGHILNLAVKLLLFGGKISELSIEQQECVEGLLSEQVEDTGEKRVREWWARGVVGKLHNIVVFIRWTPQH